MRYWGDQSSSNISGVSGTQHVTAANFRCLDGGGKSRCGISAKLDCLDILLLLPVIEVLLYVFFVLGVTHCLVAQSQSSC